MALHAPPGEHRRFVDHTAHSSVPEPGTQAVLGARGPVDAP